MRRLFTSLLFSALTVFAFGQTLSGTILDAENGDALIGASVLVKGTNQGVATDFDGKFTIENVGKGSQTIFIT